MVALKSFAPLEVAKFDDENAASNSTACLFDKVGYGLFSFADLNRLEDDPFLLGEAAFDDFMQRSLLMSGRFTLREGVLATTDSNMTYVMWNAVLSEKVPSMSSENHVLERLNRTLDSLKKNHAGLVVAKSGVPFHSYESSSRAKAEIALISGVSMVLILLLLLYVFRSMLPIAATLLTIAVAIFSALSFTWFVFGNIHVFTFVFGTSVIGVSIDYAVHFWTHWKERTLGASRSRCVRNIIFKSLLLGFMTTEFSYLALTFADFPLLCQMAVFSMVGLLSSFKQTGLVQDVRVVPMSGKRQYLAAAIVLNEAGREKFAGASKLSINNYFHDYLLQFIENTVSPKKWRYLEELPQNTEGKIRMRDIQALFNLAESPNFKILKFRREPGVLTVKLVFPTTSDYYDGHFPEFKLLPAVVQVDMVLRLHRYRDRRFSSCRLDRHR